MTPGPMWTWSPMPTWPAMTAPLPTVRGAGDAGERDEDDVFADVAVVADVDEVVDLGSAADAGLLERAAVDGGVGADFDVVFDEEGSLLRELGVGAGGGVADVAEAVCTEDCAGVDDDAVAEGGAGVEDGAGIDAAVVRR